MAGGKGSRLEPFTKILPKPGMIVIFPAEYIHSVEYNGESDRVILGINFYIYWSNLLKVNKAYKIQIIKFHLNR